MRRVGFVLKVKKDRIEEYKEHHVNVWPEMQDALRESGWHNYSLFLRDDGTLFGYFETPHSLAQAQALMEATAVNTRWQNLMAPLFEAAGRPDESFIELQEVFHLD